MNKISGVRSVDFKIIAKGHGVVNWNGSTELAGDGAKTFDNHAMPKLRGYSNLTNRTKEGTDYKYRKQAQDINFKETPLYISQNCVRHHLFREFSYDGHYISQKNAITAIASVLGLVRGYVVTKSSLKRTSPLLITDLVDTLGNGNFEQFTTDMPLVEKDGKFTRSANSIYSKTTFGDTEYIGHGSINIEQLQFISLDHRYDRCSLVIKKGEGVVVAEKITEFLNSIKKSEKLNPVATFHENYCRKGVIFNYGEVGVLLNDDAIQILVDETISRIENLYIKQAKGYMAVTEVIIDYNDSPKAMRIKTNESEIESVRLDDFAVYFEAK